MKTICKFLVEEVKIYHTSGVKEQKQPKITKYSVCLAPYLRNHTSNSNDCHLRCLCVK